MTVFFAFLHHAAAFALVAALAAQMVLLRSKLVPLTARRLQAIDAVYGAAARRVVLILLCAAMMARGIGFFG